MQPHGRVSTDVVVHWGTRQDRQAVAVETTVGQGALGAPHCETVDVRVWVEVTVVVRRTVAVWVWVLVLVRVVLLIIVLLMMTVWGGCVTVRVCSRM